MGKYSLLPKPSVFEPHADYTNSDAFTKREAAAEELYIRQEEKAKYVHLCTLHDATPAIPHVDLSGHTTDDI